MTGTFPITNTPLIIPGVRAWYDASTTSAGAVSSWTDKSGNGNHATQGTGAKQPVSTANQLAGKNALIFTGASSQTLILPSRLYTIPNSANTIFCVSKRNTETGAAARIVAIDQSTNFKFVFGYSSVSGAAVFTNSNGGTTADVTGLTNTNYQILAGSYNGTTGQYMQANNGTPTTNASGVAVATCDNAYIGSAGDASRYLTGGIAEIIIYNRALSAAEIIQINRYLANKWAMPI